MKKYFGTETVEATPMTVGDYYTKMGLTNPVDEDPKREGYLIVYSNEQGKFTLDDNNFQTWSPKKDFEELYHEGISTVVRMRCQSKKESINGGNAKNPISTSIELNIPYDLNSIYFQMSGGTGLTLHTINQEAANMFFLGKDYDIVISPSVAE